LCGAHIAFVDGGYGASYDPSGNQGPGSIPFSSETSDALNGHRQYSQEFRLESLTSGPLKWQTGVYLFRERYLINSVSYDTIFHGPDTSVQTSQVLLFVYLGAFATGTLAGGPIGDRIGRKRVIWVSILGPLPFTLLLPHVDLFWTVALTVAIGVILSSAFSAILVYAQELVPGRVGMVAGLFFGLAFGMGGIGSALLGELADRTSITFVFQVCAFLPLIGILTWLLPDIEEKRPAL